MWVIELRMNTPTAATMTGSQSDAMNAMTNLLFCAELAHEAEHVGVAPVLGDLPVAHVEDVRLGDRVLLARRRQTHEVALMLAVRGQTDRDLVVLGNHVVDFH